MLAIYWLKKFNSLLIIFLFLAIVVLHLFEVSHIPSGVYIDETSIGYNAVLISQTGVDEHGKNFPIFFEAFGEYKNPIYIYVTALIFKLFGISILNLRFTSFIFYIIALFFTSVLILKLFNKNYIVFVYFLLSFGSLPHFFVISRISFEVISQLAWISGFMLLVYKIFHEPQSKLSYLEVIICGLVLGTSIYTYSTARLLSFLTLALLWVIYYSARNFKLLLTITFTFGFSLFPYIFFSLENQGAVTKRFKLISYIDDSISIFLKIKTFIINFASSFSPNFLIVNGDVNLRHSIGYGGIIFVVTYILFIIGLIQIFKSQLLDKSYNKFVVFIIANLFLSPTASALIIQEQTPSSLRCLLLGYYILIISCYGLNFLLQILLSKRIAKITMLMVFTFLTLEIFLYQYQYFFIYPSKSVQAMGSLGLMPSLEFAVSHNPDKIIFVGSSNFYTNLKFYSYVVNELHKIPIDVQKKAAPQSKTCIVYHRWNEKKINNLSLQFSDYEPTQYSNIFKKILGRDPMKGIVKARCYE